MSPTITYIAQRLSSLYDREEAVAVAYWVAEELTGMQQWQLRLERQPLVIDDHQLEIVILRMLQHEPVQYIFGHTIWDGMDLTLNADTLIPRPETAELIELVMSRWSSLFGHEIQSVIDIGTGSGCIAIAIKKRLAALAVKGIDIAAQAVEAARRNACRIGVDVAFEIDDVFSDQFTQQLETDATLIISNPPYIVEDERAAMSKNVLDYEPSRALFVPNNDPLRFYRRMASFHAPYLAFEINPLFADDMQTMLAQMGYDSSVHLDSAGKQRFILATINHKP